ncbi:DNA helicase PcrA [Candidatus Solincola tengchongensis]|uniref:DNA helicase PcrA n=1 Tax=Candidatus Solincola tengchongensis TaxID=2900693 RepID=UPI00257DF615|nr:DNA helicase PcrA [Candidatus Solincola tengchongensis]
MTDKKETDILKELNPEQREAALHFDGPLLILAGAGSGKTRVLTYRVALLVASGRAAPENILAITFTNKAAEEMRGRIHHLVGQKASSIWISTFHAACARILRREAERLGFRKNFVIYDDEDQLRLVGRVMREQDLDVKRFPPRVVRAVIEKAKIDMLDPEGFRSRVHDDLTQVASVVYLAYQEELRRNNAMDFDDLLLNTIALFELFPAVLEHYQRRFTYINVDEYQDTNPAQYRLVRLLSASHRNLCVVGDDDQGIYSWRGADLRNILEFERDFPEARVVRLERNYRSTRVILEAANHVVSRIAGRREKRLWTEREEGEPIRYLFAPSGSEEAAFVAAEVDRLVEERGYRHRDIAVFYRTNAQSRPFEEVFLRAGIPYKIVGGFKFYERKEVKDVLAYLKFILNPDDAVNLRRIINEPRRGIGETTLAHLEGFARKEGISLWEAIRRADEVPALGQAARRKLGEFAELVEELRGRSAETPLPDFMRLVLERTGYLEALRREGTFEAEGRLENLEELLNAATDFHAVHPGEGLEAFLERTSLVAEIDLYDEEEGAVTLMTLHNAKGLEFPVVFIVGMEDGVFPHLRCMDSEASMEEERRLFYVGVTRAKDLLYLTGAATRSQYGDLRFLPESRFIRDIPTRCLEVLSTFQWERGKALENAEERRLESLAASYRVGDRVVHEVWGEGTVMGVSRGRSGPEITVHFRGVGEKLLLLQYAPIRKVG